MDDAARTRATYDVLLEVAKYLDEKDLANLAAASQALNAPLSRLALKLGLTRVLSTQDPDEVTDQIIDVHDTDQYPKPLTHAIENGDIHLLSRAFNLLDSLHAQGWTWWQLYGRGVAALLILAAGHNLESLQYLVRKFPLLPSSSIMPPESESELSVFDNSFYSSGIGSYRSGILADMKNEALVLVALRSDRYDCASFLLGLEPPLFPGGFQLGIYDTCYSSATTLQFLIDHGSYIGPGTLHRVASMEDLPDVRVFDILVQSIGIDVNKPCLAIEGMTTPLFAACDCLQPINVEALLRLGAEPNEPNGSLWIRKAPYMVSAFHYTSPNPILTLLFTQFWDMVRWNNYQDIGRRFIKCLQSLLRYGARISVPLQDGNILEVLVLRLWKCICHELMNRPEFVLPVCPDDPDDIEQGVQSMLLALNEVSVSPWDELCQIIYDADPTWRGIAGQTTTGKMQLVKVLRHYQERYRDLPGPARLKGRSHLFLPDRFGARLGVY
ncbi:hypothetical protein F5B18DRAFT_74333 [Nemania serpens]|nr:hypothetical protein F5B18DRAFT_74333 [Nemania serpens]